MEERMNRQDLIEVFKIYQGKSIIGLQDLFTLDKNNKGTRGHTLKLSKMRSTRDCFFSNRVVNRWNMLDQQIVEATSLNAFKNGLDKLRKTKMGGWVKIKTTKIFIIYHSQMTDSLYISSINILYFTILCYTLCGLRSDTPFLMNE